MAYRSRTFRKAKNITPEKWHTLYTTGKPLMLKLQSYAATTGWDQVLFVVPQGERWVINYLFMENNSTQSVVGYMEIVDEDDSLIATLHSETLADTASMAYPEGRAANEGGERGADIVLYETQKLRFRLAAHGSKTDTWEIYANVLQFKVGDQ